MKRFVASALALTYACICLVCCTGGKGDAEASVPEEIGTEEAPSEEVSADSLAADSTRINQISTDMNNSISAEPEFDIITSLGTIRVKLYSETPGHRDNFVKLAREGFYDGTLFHRVINDFMIQGGDPLTKDEENYAQFGTGGPGYTIPAEIISGLTHKKGALAAARRGDMANPFRESSGSQFYIVQSESGCKHLDGQYTIFGETVSGMDVIDKIAAAEVDYRDCPVNNIRIIKIKLAE